MERHKHSIQYDYYSTVNELNDSITEAIQEAKSAAESTYSPYSDFPVGCCITLEGGKRIKASNQENAAYPSGLCAERVGMFYAKSNFPNHQVEFITIYAPKAKMKSQPISPCGSCRQVMSEYEQLQGHPIEIFLVNGNDEVWHFNSIEDLLPFPFLLDQLK